MRESDAIRKILFGVGAGCVAAILLVVAWQAAAVLLLIFASVLFAVSLTRVSEFVSGCLKLSYGVALFGVVLVLGGTATVVSLAVAPSIAVQFAELRERLPEAVNTVEGRIARHVWGRELLESAELESLPKGGERAAAFVAQFALGALHTIGALFLFLFLSIFFAAEPRLYTRGLLKLFPTARRARIQEVLTAIADNLHWWLIGTLVSMAIVGITTWVGLLVLGVPLALALALFAAILTFIPNLGPIVAAVPAVLLALLEGTTLAGYVIVLYLAIQTVESYGITPLIQRESISQPPALTIASQVLFGALLGGLGIALATPLTATCLVVVHMLYVEDVLGDVASSEGAVSRG